MGFVSEYILVERIVVKKAFCLIKCEAPEKNKLKTIVLEAIGKRTQMRIRFDGSIIKRSRLLPLGQEREARPRQA